MAYTKFSVEFFFILSQLIKPKFLCLNSLAEKYSFGTTHYVFESDVVMFSNFIIILQMCFLIRHLGTHYPDHALAVVSAAGWIKKEDYSDSNLFFRHDISTSHTSPAVKAILEACIAENDPDKHVSNLHVSTAACLCSD